MNFWQEKSRIQRRPDPNGETNNRALLTAQYTLPIYDHMTDFQEISETTMRAIPINAIKLTESLLYLPKNHKISGDNYIIRIAVRKL